MSANFNPILTCEQIALVDADIVTPTPPAEPSIISAVWKNTAKDKELSFAGVEVIVCIEIKTTDFTNGEKVTIEIKEDKKDAEVLKSLEVETNINEAITDTEGDNAITIDKDWINKKLVINVTSDKTELFKGKTIQIGCCSECVEIDNNGDFIEELHVRLCGFGGIQPLRVAGNILEKAVKQFQKDYMKVAETGLICKHLLISLDEFMDKYLIPFEQLKCTCDSSSSEILNHITGNNETGSCSGFGNIDDQKNNTILTRKEEAPTKGTEKNDAGKDVEVFKDTTHTIENGYSTYVLAYDKNGTSKTNREWLKVDNNRKITTKKYITKLKYSVSAGSKSCYEYPGMHRSLMWVYKAIAFYLEKEYGDTTTKYTINKINSAYRCRYQQTFQNASTGLTFNHMGTALDIHFNKNGTRTTDHPKEMDKLRDEICVKYIGAHSGWAANKLGLELAKHGAKSWIHIDVREFNNIYKADKFFKTTLDDINGDKLCDAIKTIDNGKFKKIIES
ncbi:hypothetical protein [Dysgonomonas sp. ZJ279]|uniref:hypothetical protein n=1 Tax=Dysgonomonas sp. ZJ279 TaxID=2709796 RepID=UPI0013EA62B1|nr:hypothetical protein [Dysgonomonas sp. ZJ279]